MPVNTIEAANKRMQAEGIGEALADLTDVEACDADVPKMTDADLYEWLEVWGYKWNGRVWMREEVTE